MAEQTLSFSKDNKRWYIDIEDWEGTKGELEMVAGADLLIDKLDTDNDGKVTVTVDTKDFDNSNIKLKRMFKSLGGATYLATSEVFTRPIWLCAVTKHVFNNTLPKRIYIKATI